MTKRAKAAVMENDFVDRVRGEWTFDTAAYEELVESLRRLAERLASQRTIDRDLALTLYVIPQMVRNAHLQAAELGAEQSAMAERLEEAWIELDALVLKCLSNRRATPVNP